jgi:hypothetical protein
MSDTTPYVILGTDFSTAVNARSLTEGTGINITDLGSQQPVVVSLGGTILQLLNLSSSGIVRWNNSTGHFGTLFFIGGNGITISNPDGAGNVTISQLENTVLQQVQVSDTSGVVGQYSNIEFAAGSGATVTVTDIDLGAKALVTISATGGGGGGGATLNSSSGLVCAPTSTPGTALTVDFPTGSNHQILTTNGTTASFSNILSVLGSYMASNTLIVGAGTSNPASVLTAPSANQFLQTNGQGAIVWGSGGSGTGTVTSVAASSSSGLTIGGSPITTSGTITVDLPTGTAGQVLAINTTGPQTLHWINASGSGTVTSVGISSSTGLTIGSTPVTGSGTITVDLPSGGSAGQVLAVNTTGPQTLHWINASGSGTVTSVGISSSTGLTIGSTPVTGSGTITVDLPSGGSVGQVLAVNTTGPQTLHWINASGSGTVTSVAVTSANTAIGITGSPITGSGTIQLTNQWWNVAAGSPISIGNFAINNCNALQLVQNGSPEAPSDNTGVISFNGTTGLFADLNNGTSTTNYNVVLSTTTNYGVQNTLLVGNGGNYTPLPAGDNGQVLQISGGNVVWGSGGGGGTTVVFGQGQFTASASPGDPVFITVADTNVTSDTIPVVSSSQINGQNGATGPYDIVVTPSTGFVINSYSTGAGGDQSKFVTYCYNV